MCVFQCVSVREGGTVNVCVFVRVFVCVSEREIYKFGVSEGNK